MSDNIKRPKSRIAWLWQNMKGFHALYIVAMFGTIAYNALQLTVPVFSGQIIDNFLTGENARENMETNSSWFFTLVALMVGLTLVRVVIVYTDCLAYEHCSQKVLYRVRVQLYDKIQHQDMTFFKKYGTGDLMTRVTGDLDAIRHMTAWVVRVMIESVSLFTAAAVYFFTVDVKMALCILVISPFVLIIIIAFKKQVAPMHAALREKFAGMNSIAQENIAGNRAVKASADGLIAFDSPNFPPLASAGIDIEYNEGLLLAGQEGPFRAVKVGSSGIGVIKVFPGINFDIFRPIFTDDLNAIVLETFGTGNIPDYDESLVPLLERSIKKGTIVCVCTQCAQGTVRLGAYETSSALAKAGAVSGSDMTTEAAVAKLYYLLSKGIDKAQIRRLMEENLRGEL